MLSLTIIGVVAAITLPSLTGNINERTWNTQRKALYARFSQAIALMPALNGYGTVIEGDSSTSAVDTAAETFVTAGLSKVLKINNICDSEHLKDCGIADKYIALDGTNIGSMPSTFKDLNSMFQGSYQPLDGDGSPMGSPVVYSQQANTKAAAFETQNGESIVVYYNPACQIDLNTKGWHFVQPTVCANFIYDLNGNKGPNTMGKDVGFMTAFYATSSVVVAPVSQRTSAYSGTWAVVQGKCRQQDEDSRLPNKEELASLFVNKKFLFESNNAHYWSSSLAEPGQAYVVQFSTGSMSFVGTAGERFALCVKR